MWARSVEEDDNGVRQWPTLTVVATGDDRGE